MDTINFSLFAPKKKTNLAIKGLQEQVLALIQGAGIFAGDVEYFADLPDPVDLPSRIYVVKKASGIPLINRKESGLYFSDGLSWTFLDSSNTELAKYTVNGVAHTTANLTLEGSNIGLELDTAASKIKFILPSHHQNIIGDIKHGFQPTDHNGWVKLDGRAKALLTATQQTNATLLGIGSTIPNASNAYLSQTSGSLGSLTSSNTRTILRSDLPNVTLSGTTGSTTDSHSHSFSSNTTTDSQSASHTHSFSSSGTSGSTTDSHTHSLGSSSLTTSSTDLSHSHTQSGTFTTATNGNHNHSIGPVLHAYSDGTQGNGGDGSGLSVSQTGYGGSHTHSVTISGNTSSALSSHSHTINLSSGNTGSGGNSHSHSISVSGTTGSASGSHSHSVSVSGTTGSGGNSHSHSFTTSSVNGGVTQTFLDVRPSTMNANIFIYLGL